MLGKDNPWFCSGWFSSQVGTYTAILHLVHLVLLVLSQLQYKYRYNITCTEIQI